MRSLVLALITLALTLAAAGPATAAIDPQPGFGPSVFADEANDTNVRWITALGNDFCPVDTVKWAYIALAGGNQALTDSVNQQYQGNGCYTYIQTNQPIDLSSSPYCRVFFRMILDIVAGDHVVIQSIVGGMAYEEAFYTVADNTSAFRAFSSRISKGLGPAVYLRFLIHGFGASTSDGVYLDDFDVRCDTIAPANPTLSSSSHTIGIASSDPNVVVNLAGANDFSALASGVAGYSYGLDASPATVPDIVKDADASLTTLTLPTAPGTYYFHLRTVDGAGNWSAPVHLGPLVVKPVPILGLLATKLSGRWAASKYSGSIDLALKATEPMSVAVELRGKGLRTPYAYRCAKRSDCAGEGRYAIPADTSRLRLKLPAGVQPGAFTISVTATNVVAAGSKQFRIGAPREGVLDTIYFSGRANGSPASRIPSHPRQAFLVYRFASRPRIGPVHVEFRVGGAVRPFEIPIGLVADGRRDNRLIRDVPTLHGRWTAIMSVRGKTIGRATVVFP